MYGPASAPPAYGQPVYGPPGYGQPAYGPPGYPVPPYGSAYGGSDPSLVAPVPSGVNALAIVSLVLGILGWFGITLIASVVVGIQALRDIRKTGQRGRGVAIAGLVLSGVWALVLGCVVVLAVVGAGSSRSTAGSGAGAGVSTSPADTSMIPLGRLKIGDCIEDITEGRTVTRLKVVSCTTTHEGEVVGRFSLPAGTYPGDDEVDQQSSDGCADRLDAYSPGSLDSPLVEVFFFGPTQSSWKRTGGRDVICMAVSSPAANRSLKG